MTHTACAAANPCVPSGSRSSASRAELEAATVTRGSYRTACVSGWTCRTVMLFCGGDDGVGCQPLNHLNHVEAAAKCTNHSRSNQTVPGTQPPSNIKHCLTRRPQLMTPLLPPPYAACTIPSTSQLMSMDSPPQLGLQFLPTSAMSCRPNKQKQIKRRTILLLFILINATPTGKFFLKPKTP